MQLRIWFLFLLFVGSGLLTSSSLRAQCLPLARLDRGIAAGRLTADSLQALLPAGEWVGHNETDPYWTYRSGPAEDSVNEDAPAAWVGLRRSNQQPHYDLVYKTFQRACITRLRAELRRRGKLKSEFIICEQCEGERLIGEGYIVTIFQQKVAVAKGRTTYPYVLVLRRTETSTSEDKSMPEDSLRGISKSE